LYKNADLFSRLYRPAEDKMLSPPVTEDLEKLSEPQQKEGRSKF